MTGRLRSILFFLRKSLRIKFVLFNYMQNFPCTTTFIWFLLPSLEFTSDRHHQLNNFQYRDKLLYRKAYQFTNDQIRFERIIYFRHPYNPINKSFSFPLSFHTDEKKLLSASLGRLWRCFFVSCSSSVTGSLTPPYCTPSFALFFAWLFVSYLHPSRSEWRHYIRYRPFRN